MISPKSFLKHKLSYETNRSLQVLQTNKQLHVISVPAVYND